MLCFRVIMLWREGSQYLFFIRQILCQKCLCQTVASGGVKHFHIVMCSYAASFSIKQVFVRLATFSSSKKTKTRKKNAWFWKCIKNKGKVMLDIFQNFAYVSSYLHFKSISWKQVEVDRAHYRNFFESSIS